MGIATKRRGQRPRDGSHALVMPAALRAMPDSYVSVRTGTLRRLLFRDPFEAAV